MEKLKIDIVALKYQMEHDKEMKMESFVERYEITERTDALLKKKEIEMLQKFINQINIIINEHIIHS